jgi:hypothetical protein
MMTNNMLVKAVNKVICRTTPKINSTANRGSQCRDSILTLHRYRHGLDDIGDQFVW